MPEAPNNNLWLIILIKYYPVEDSFILLGNLGKRIVYTFSVIKNLGIPFLGESHAEFTHVAYSLGSMDL